MAKATFGAGCFWGVEAAFRAIDGVIATAVGYIGGTTEDPSYEDVCRGDTGHAEVVQIDFDPARVTYDQLLELFWDLHDPTTLNRQGPDVGTQYRSAAFTHGPDQEAAARASKQRHAVKLGQTIVTEITPSGPFHVAEEYHQRFFEKRAAAAAAGR